MRIVCAPDSFKESMTAAQACAAMARGIALADPAAEVIQVPMADGGEGTMQALVDALGGTLHEVTVGDPLLRRVPARLGWVAAQRLAVVEVAQAVGLDLVTTAERDPMRSTSFGVGELIAHALDLGAERIVVGLGGSATNDGGAGMAVALGARLLDAAGRPLTGAPAQLSEAVTLDLSGLDPRLAATRVLIASDVTNPLLGPDGATRVFGPQKGLPADGLEAADDALRAWCDLLEDATAREVRDVPGAGAAGGLGAALLALAKAEVEPGVELVMRLVGLDEHLAGADVVFTGEGSIDEQTRLGKTPWGVARLAARHGVPSVLFGGRVAAGAQGLLDDSTLALVPIMAGPADLATALREGPENLARAARMATALLARNTSQ